MKLTSATTGLSKNVDSTEETEMKKQAQGHRNSSSPRAGYLALCMLALVACASESEIDTSQAGLADLDYAPEELREPPVLVTEWVFSSKGITETPSNTPLRLRVKNISPHTVEYSVDVELLGLRRRREQPLAAPMLLQPEEEASFEWSPASSPIQPIGTAVEAIGKVHYALWVRDDEGKEERVGGTFSTEHLLMSYSSDYSQVFVTRDDDVGVRFAALATTEMAPRVRASEPLVTRLRPLFELMESPRGRLDGALTTTEQMVRLAEDEESHSETLGIDDDITEIAANALQDHSRAGSSSASSDVSPMNHEAPPTSCAQGVGYRNVCIEYRSNGMYNDSAISSSIPNEDHLIGNQRAAWTYARIWSGTDSTWSNHLDWAGCTGWGTTGHGIPMCKGPGDTVIAWAIVSIGYARRGGHVNGNWHSSPSFHVTPHRNYIANIYSQSSTFAHMRIETQNRWTRSGALISRALQQDDVGLFTHNNVSNIRFDVTSGPVGLFGYSDPNGYADSDEQPWGEASATLGAISDPVVGDNTRLISLGRSVVKLSNGSYEALPYHTTQSKYTLAHELGHTIQGIHNGYPGYQGYGGMPTGLSPCRCDYVQSGNQVHCLGSRHSYTDSNVEGFAHYIAALVTNNTGPGENCRFTYYKTHVSSATHFFDNYYLLATVAPPAPVNCGVPYQSGSTSGWMRRWCSTNPSGGSAMGSYGTERDWLTFLWAAGGGAPTNARSTVPTLATLFRTPPSGGTFNWNLVWTRAGTLPAAVRNRVDQQAFVHGLR